MTKTKAKDLEAGLAAAIAAAKQGDDRGALAHTLAAWREGRGQRLAALVELASARVSRGRPPVVAKKSMEASWQARAADEDPADVPTLLKLLGEGRAEQIIARIETLSKWPDDPRVHAKWVECLVEPPLAGKAGRRVSRRVFQAMKDSHDPELARIAAEILAENEPYQYVYPRLHAMAASVWKDFQSLAAEMKKWTPPPALGKNALALCDALEATLTSERAGVRSGEALLAAVYAAPADDEPRLVYADWLSEQGDPRGEFIVLQCERAKNGSAPSKREKQLEKQFGRAWAGPLGTKMARTTLRFSRGFLAECSVARLRPEPEGYLGHPSWATVEVVHFDDAGVGAVEVLNHPVCVSVLAVLGLPGSELYKLTRQVKRLGIRYFEFPGNAEALVAQRGLRCLEIERGGDQPALLAFLEENMPWVEEIVAGKKT